MVELKHQYTLFDGANLTAKWLLEIGAVEFRPEEPFTWTSGRQSPLYVDVRKIMGRPGARAQINMMAYNRIFEVVGADHINYVAGGETAGIPFAALIAERMHKPMCYVRKKAKGFGHDAQIECLTDEQLNGKNIILIEDLCSDGGSKKIFVDAIRRSNNMITDVFTIFSYGCFNATATLARDGVRLISLTDGLTLVDVADDLDWSTKEARAEIRKFLAAPDAWQQLTVPH